MTELSESRSRSASLRLLEVATPGLYRRNPFRVVGLSTGATTTQVRQRRQIVLTALRVGAPVPGGETRLPLRAPLTEDEANTAFSTLANPEHRLVDELFWWWGPPDSCGCPERLHHLHDEAVHAHAAVLDMEWLPGPTLAGDRTSAWTRAALAWSAVLGDELFWNHMRHRVNATGDRRIDQSTVEGLRQTMPRALLGPQVALAAAAETPPPLDTLLGKWKFDRSVIEDAHHAAAASTYERVNALVVELAGSLNQGRRTDVARRLVDELVPAAQRMDRLVPHDQFRRSSSLRNKVAVVLNNCALALGEESRREHHTTIAELLFTARDLVTDEETRTAVEDNLERYRHPPAAPRTARPPPAPGSLRGRPAPRTPTSLTDLWGSPRTAGSLMSLAVCLALVAFSAATGWGEQSTVRIILGNAAVAAGASIVVNTNWFARGPRSAPRWAGRLALFLSAAALGGAVVESGWSITLLCVAAFVGSLPVTWPIGRFIGKEVDAA